MHDCAVHTLLSMNKAIHFVHFIFNVENVSENPKNTNNNIHAQRLKIEIIYQNPYTNGCTLREICTKTLKGLLYV